MQRLRALRYLAVAAVASLSMADVDAAVTVDCQFEGGSSFVTRGFYIDAYSGSTIDTVTLAHSASVAGDRTIALSVRQSTYDGTLLGVAQVTRNIGTTKTKTVFDFGGLPVTFGTRIVFSQAVIAGDPANVFYDRGVTPCFGVATTVDTAPPLSAFFRASAGVNMTGDYFSTSYALNLSCPWSVNGPGDSYVRGFYVTDYRGTTIDSVRLRHQANVAGNRNISLIARLNSYDGPLVGVANVTRNITTDWTESVFDFGHAPVPAGSLVTFQQVLNAGATPLLYDYGYGPCNTVTQTFGVAPALDAASRDSAGVKIWGRVASTNAVQVVEYLHTGFGHYFTTADPGEIAGLDGGAYGGVFTRTGQSFYVRDGPAPGLTDVCRFFTVTFAPKSSHFYTGDAGECAGVKLNPDWFYEKIAYFTRLPTAGACSPGYVAVYRAYNNGQTGAPNHRFTTSLATYNDLVDNHGWAGEGVRFCSVLLI